MDVTAIPESLTVLLLPLITRKYWGAVYPGVPSSTMVNIAAMELTLSRAVTVLKRTGLVDAANVTFGESWPSKRSGIGVPKPMGTK